MQQLGTFASFSLSREVFSAIWLHLFLRVSSPCCKDGRTDQRRNRTEHKTVREKNAQCPQSTASHRPERERETVEATRKEREREHFSLVCKVLSCSVSSRSEERREENTTKRTRKKKVGQSGGDQPVGQSDAKISFFLSSRVIGALGPDRARSAVLSPSMRELRPEGDP